MSRYGDWTVLQGCATGATRGEGSTTRQERMAGALASGLDPGLTEAVETLSLQLPRPVLIPGSWNLRVPDRI